MNIKNIFISFNILLIVAALTGCTDELLVNDNLDYTITGEPVTATFTVELPQMDVQTRGELGYEELNQVSSLWVRTYSANSGEATSDWLVVTEGLPVNQAEQDYGPLDITLHTHSGANYIIAVANVDNYGVTKDDPATQKKLSELLEKADTWSDFLNIAVVSPSSSNECYAPNTPLPMAGCYTNVVSGGAHWDIDQWQNENFQSYFIPASHSTVELTNGVIHLRRLVSQIKFNVSAANDDLTVTVNSYSIYNVPTATWLYERSSDNGMQPNFGDNATEETLSTYLADIPKFVSQYVDVNNGVSSFDYWQAENKHTGNATKYTDRETMVDYNAEVPVFTSLSGDTWTTNDMASYVKVSCTVEYKGTMKVNSQGVVTDEDGKEVYRVGNADYYIHLGYLNNDATDFNCYRNVKYTYNVSINGVDDIRVDAYAEGALDYPGEAGIVTDIETANIYLDCHYHAFNITLTDDDLGSKDDSGKDAFGFLITTYKSGRRYIFDEQTDFSEVTDRHLYNWIELRRVSSELNVSTLAKYEPSYNLAAEVSNHTMTADETFLITELNVRRDMGLVTAGTYTVFINEYSYETMFGEDGYGDETTSGSSPNWMTYVNQDPRRLFIKVNQKKSEDGNRIYARSKYGVSQQSMQTYYNTLSVSSLNSGKNAIAVERENESEGLNLRPTTNSYGSSIDNGRYNLAQYLSNSTGTNGITGTGGILSASNRPSWSTFLDLTEFQQRPEVSGTRAQNGPALSERTVANGNPIYLPKLANNGTNNTSTFNDAYSGTDQQYYITTYNACTNRNRDNNGNGKIDPEEVRWYIPAMDGYMDLLVGSNSLSQPVLDFSTVSALPKVNSEESGSEWSTSGVLSNHYCSRYMFVSSNGATGKNVLWGMEGMSTSTWGDVSSSGWSNSTSHPWQVRCIRNLGTNLSNINTTSQIGTAFQYSNNIVSFTYYDLASIRFARYTGNGTGSTQMPVHTIPNAYNSVYQAFEIDTQNIDVSNTDKSDLINYINSNPCSARDTATKKTGWRIPNQKELGIMSTIDEILTANGSYLSCTANYFNSKTGIGANISGSALDDTYIFLGFLGSGTGGIRGVQFTSGTYGNLNYYTMYVRCVRDTDQTGN